LESEATRSGRSSGCVESKYKIILCISGIGAVYEEFGLFGAFWREHLDLYRWITINAYCFLFLGAD
jgi:hypothetical protein